MTAPGFGAEYTVSDVTGLVNSLNQDMITTERNTIINYDGSERWDTYNEAYNWLTSLYMLTEKNLPVPYSFNRIRAEQNHVVLQDTDGKFYVDKAVFTEYFKHTQAELFEIDSMVAEILTEIIAPEMTEAQKVNAVYGFVIDTIHYQFQQTDGNIDGLIKERNVLGALTDGTGVVCDAYAFLTSRMLTQLGFENHFVAGKIVNPDGSNGGGHAWNLVKVNGNWHQLDATLGDFGIEEQIAKA